MCRCQKVEQRRQNEMNPRKFVGLAPSHNTQRLMLHNVNTCPLFLTSTVASMHNLHSAAAPSAVRVNLILFVDPILLIAHLRQPREKADETDILLLNHLSLPDSAVRWSIRAGNGQYVLT